MGNERMLIQMEKRITGKLLKIKTGLISPKDSNIGILLKPMKNMDNALYDILIMKYKQILVDLGE